LEEFLFPKASDRWLTILRTGLGIQTLLCCWSLRGDWNSLFRANGEGIISRDLPEAILDAQSPFIPRLGWLIQIGKMLGVSENLALSTIWLVLFCASLLLLVGLFSRFAAVATWFLYLCAAKSGNLMTYGMDNFVMIGLFYLMLSPLPDSRSIDYRIWSQRSKDPHLIGFFQRVLQLHLCVIYFSSGLAKSLGAGWWNGTSLWRSLSSPPFDVVPVQILVSFHWLLPFLGISAFFFELGYPIFIWPKRTRFLWVVGIMAMHAAIGLTMGLYLFALIMIILNLAAFGPELLRLDKTEAELTPAGLDQSSSLQP
jgi:hypothetical protein